MKHLTVKKILPSWISSSREPRDGIQSPKEMSDSCDCASRGRSTAAYRPICLICISKNLHSITPLQQPFLGPEQPHLISIDKLYLDQIEAMKIHNEARKAATQYSSVSRPSLIWDSHVAAEAGRWAQRLASANVGLVYSTSEERPGQGENLYWMSAGGTLADASRRWIDDGRLYHGEKIEEGDFESYRHYTQVIWPSTTKAGLAFARNAQGETFIVGRYSVPGNCAGESAFTGK